MKNITIPLGIFILVCFNFSCQKNIDFNGESIHEPILYIECILYPGEIPKAYLSQSQPFFNEKITPQEVFARGALVKISNGNDVDILTPDSTYDKFRCRWSPYYRGLKEIKQGEKYSFIIDFNNKVYTAETEINQSKINIDSVEYIEEFYDVYGGHDGVTISFKDSPGEDNFYRFQMDRWIDNTRMHAHILDVVQSNCTEDSELFFVRDMGRTIFSDATSDGKKMEFNAEVSFEYLKGDTAHIYLLSLDEDSAEFFQELDNQLQSILNPFVEPNFIHSKIEGTLGIFGSAVRSDPVIFIYPQDHPP